VENRQHWEAEAESWVQWARTPGHDAYWYYRDAFFDGIVPSPGVATLEVGCGEGRVTRDLVARGHRVISVDGSVTLLRHAAALDRSGRYVLADATRLPVATASVDLAIAYNSLMDFDDLPAAVAEVARVLRPGSSFCICIVHPMTDGGRLASDGPDAPYVLAGKYFGTRPFEDQVERDGLTMHFRGKSHSLETYFNALSGADFAVDALREPIPDKAPDHYQQWNRFPMFLYLRAVKF
jgi:SAM-dependent methyltransferase